MKKWTATILSLFACTAFVSAGTAFLHAQKTHAVSAEESAVTELISPASYEEYLPLTAPTSVSVTESGMTITDGTSLYFYDRAENTYFHYAHTSEVTKAELSDNGTVYFLSSLRLYEISTEDVKRGESATLVSVCYNFTADNKTLYYYDNAQTILSSDGKSIPLPYALQSGSPLTFKDGLLYCVCKNTSNGLFAVYAVNPQTNSVTPIASFAEPLLSIALANNQLCAVTESGSFYAYAQAELNATELPAPILQKEGGYSYLSAHEDYVYAVRRTSVYQYATESASFTEYEIGSSSASPKRFHGASDLYLSETKLFIADAENHRITVYDAENSTFEAWIQTDLAVSRLVSYTDTLLACSEKEFVLYNLSEKHYGEELLRLADTNGKIIGVTGVYNRYYVLTDTNVCYMLTQENGAWTHTETQKNTVSLRSKALASDVFGSLYVLYDNDKVYRFTEQEFLTADASGTKVLDGLKNAEKLALDYDCTLYALSQGVLTKYSLTDGIYTQSEQYIPDYDLVYDESPTLLSFTFGVRTGYAYLLYENDYLIKTDEFEIPVVSPIPVGNAKELLFGESATNTPALVQIAEGAILIEFNAEALKTASTFPYTAFARAHAPLTVAKLGEEGEYTILSARNEQTGAYKTYLVKSERCVPLAISDYYTDFGENGKTGYVSSDISLYKYPYLTDILTVAELSRGAQVTLLGEVVQLDYAYYYAKVETEEGVKTGYIPKSFINAFENQTPQPETVVLGEEGANTDAVWRVAYLLLGGALICILVDFLLLRKPKNKE